MVQIQQTKADAQPLSNVVVEPPKRNRFYVFKGREEQEKSTDVDNVNLLVFSFHVSASLDPGCTLSFVTPLATSKFDLLNEILHKPFLVKTLVGDNVRAERVYKEISQ